MYMCVANMNVPSSIAQHLQTERRLDMMLLIRSVVIAPLSSQEQIMHVSAESQSVSCSEAGTLV